MALKPTRERQLFDRATLEAMRYTGMSVEPL